jgi:hypothetical protein
MSSAQQLLDAAGRRRSPAIASRVTNSQPPPALAWPSNRTTGAPAGECLVAKDDGQLSPVRTRMQSRASAAPPASPKRVAGSAQAGSSTQQMRSGRVAGPRGPVTPRVVSLMSVLLLDRWTTPLAAAGRVRPLSLNPTDHSVDSGLVGHNATSLVGRVRRSVSRRSDGRIIRIG